MTSTLTPYSPILEAIEQAIQNDPRLKSGHSTRQYRSVLFAFEAWRDGRPLSKSLVEEYARDLQRDGYAPNTINQRLAAVRWWTRRLIDRAEESTDDPLKRAARILSGEGVKGKRAPRGRYLTPAEQTGLIGACLSDTSPAGVRDAAMIAVALSVGFRRDDLATLTMGAIRNRTDDGCDLVVTGKGDRTDTLYLYDIRPWNGYTRLQGWLAVRGMDTGPVFCQVLKNDRVNIAQDLSGEALRLILDGRQVGLGLPEHITWHDMRRTFICTLLDSDVDLSTAQKLARHASPNTTANIYDIRGERAQREALKSLNGGNHA